MSKERPILFSADTRWVRVAASRLGISAEEYAWALSEWRKICGGCRQSLPRHSEHFGKDSKTFDGMRSRCKACVAAVKKEHYEKTRPQQRARQIRYQRDNRERLYAYNAKWQRERNAKLRAEMLAAYGGACNCCGEAEPLFLDLDHIHNDGAAHRKALGNGTQVLLAIQAEGWPVDRFQILCCNCNQGKARNGGVCPHQAKR